MTRVPSKCDTSNKQHRVVASLVGPCIHTNEDPLLVVESGRSTSGLAIAPVVLSGFAVFVMRNYPLHEE